MRHAPIHGWSCVCSPFSTRYILFCPRPGSSGNAAEGVCVQDPKYSNANDFLYLIPLVFDATTGAVAQFAPFVDQFVLDLKKRS